MFGGRVLALLSLSVSPFFPLHFCLVLLFFLGCGSCSFCMHFVFELVVLVL